MTDCWAEIAALIECLDLLITVGAVVANLAAGKIGATRSHVAHDITCTINAGRPEWLMP